jgi:hypothetical protein
MEAQMPDLAKPWGVLRIPYTLNQINGSPPHAYYQRYIQKCHKEQVGYHNISHLAVWHLAIRHIGHSDGQMPDARWPDLGQIHMIYNLIRYLYVKRMQ